MLGLDRQHEKILRAVAERRTVSPTGEIDLRGASQHGACGALAPSRRIEPHKSGRGYLRVTTTRADA